MEDPRFLPKNFTDLLAIVKLVSNAKFEKVNHGDEDGLEDPEVYFTYSVSCDAEPEELAERVRQDWRRRGGNKLEVSELRCLETGPAIVLFNMSNEGNINTIRAEAHRLMKQATKHKKGTEMALGVSDADAGGEGTVPAISLQIQVPKIPGQDTSQFQEWHWKDANKRKAIHVRCNAEDVSTVQNLFEVAKAQKMVEALWGKNARVSKVIQLKARGGEVRW